MGIKYNNQMLRTGIRNLKPIRQTLKLSKSAIIGTYKSPLLTTQQRHYGDIYSHVLDIPIDAFLTTSFLSGVTGSMCFVMSDKEDDKFMYRSGKFIGMAGVCLASATVLGLWKMGTIMV